MAHFIVFLDVETTGINPLKDAIIQLSAIKYFGNQEIGRFNTYVNPGRSIPLEAASVNGITNAMVANAPNIDAIKEAFLGFIDGAILVGYNVSFDLRFINAAYGGVLDGTKYIDIMNWAHAHLDLPNYQLETVAEHLGFHTIGDFHDALTDCEAASDVFWKLCTQELLGRSNTFHTQKLAKKKTFNQFRPKEISPRMVPSNTSHPLYGKRIVFTGDLSISRHEAAQMAVDQGAFVKTSVSGKTNYLVVGEQDVAHVGENGMSGKEEKAHTLNKLGKASIEIINEKEFMSLLEGVAFSG